MARKNDIKTYLTNNKGKSVAAERFIRILRNKIYKYMISIEKMCLLIINATIHIEQLK